MITQLATETDGSGNIIEIMHCDSITEVPTLFTFVIRQAADLIDKKMMYVRTQWEDNDSSVYVLVNGKFAGNTVYNVGGPTNVPNLLWVVLSAIDEEFRGRGLYATLQKYLEQIGRDKECKYKASMIHKKNTSSLRASEKTGSFPTFNYMIKDISSN
jgi:hypothetical protein